MSDRPYSRIYWEVMADTKFDGIREDARHFGAWALMLVVADMAWPVPAYVPPVPKASVALLVKNELVDLLPGGRFRIHGLDAERGRRSGEQKNGGLVRASTAQRDAGGHFLPAVVPSGGPAVVPSVVQLSRDETRRDEYEPTRAEPDDEYDKAVKWLASKKAWISSPKVEMELARLVDRKGAEAVIAAMNRVPGAEDAAQFIYGARNALFPLRGTVVEKPEDQSQANFDRGVERTRRDMARMRGEG